MTDDVATRVAAAFAARYRPIAPQTTFFEAGLSSTVLVDILSTLKGDGFDLSLVDLYRFPSIAALAEELVRRGPRVGERTVTPVTPSVALPWADRSRG